MLAVQMANRVARDTGVRLKLMRLATLTLEQVALELPHPVPAEERRTTLASRVVNALKRVIGRGEAVVP
ncbi:hypothetical protein [Marilutibacter alkalisoli]|uniref:Uncharacterized protein n=1 Tax=Marilutibacter alkalisoli TaxID=2591633 RepID=A0A514BQR8_9GAMM|nr:hypothetical protein [Lysobacter alkalisoli]QDH69742.1 hypothetical protein FKV23_06270 [Lysobacter alkalisoli]